MKTRGSRCYAALTEIIAFQSNLSPSLTDTPLIIINTSNDKTSAVGKCDRVPSQCQGLCFNYIEFVAFSPSM